MQVIPAVDLAGSLVVHAVGGRRQAYRPLRSILATDPSPVAVARGLAETLGLKNIYLADLDAIAGAAPAWKTYEQIAACGVDLWIDAGLSGGPRAAEWAEFAAGRGWVAGVVAGLESLESPESLGEMLAMIGPKRLVFSLDLADSRPVCAAVEWRSMSPDAIVAAALAAGVRRMIVLDVARVGTAAGCGTEDLCRRIRHTDATLELTAGGGVRGTADLARLADCGCNAALVATALHDGTITRDDLAPPGLVR